MASDSVVFGSSLLLVTLGVVTLLYGEYQSISAAIYGGGTVALVGMGILTLGVAQLEEAGEHGA